MPERAINFLSAKSLTRSLNRAFTAFQTQMQSVTVIACGTNWYRLLTPFREFTKRLMNIHFETKA
ncbi:hypothetical protein TU80_19635 [Pseudomonas veronii]|nr:hypothetical protein TU80_19635 [Pseudomonas veronii]